MNSSEQLAILHLLRLVSPALPVGAYAYSQGLEHAIEVGWVVDKNSSRDWFIGLMKNSLAYVDLPLIFRLTNAWQNKNAEEINYWNNYLQAMRETKEFLLEDLQLGAALNRLMRSVNMASADDWTLLATRDISYLTLFSLAGLRCGIESRLVAMGYLWSWLENQIAVATKTIPIGQSDGQAIISELIPLIPSIVSFSETLADDELGAGLPGIALGSSLHEVQYSRLFRS